MTFDSGTRLGPYEVVAKIGEGGMGEVYRARDTKLNRDVALKVLPEAFALDAERLARFTREAQVLAALNHPNIAHIHGLEESGGVRALVMELVEGEDLSAHIARGPIPLAEALPIARQIAEALEAAHEQGIIHRDLKPANIKVRADGTVKVLDFGLAKALDQDLRTSRLHQDLRDLANSPTITTPAMTQKGMILGTAAYMSPEQARGKPVDRRADIWSFGVVFYEMLTGRRAFDGMDVSDVLDAVLRQDIDWTRLPPATPARLRRLLERCLDRDARNRLRDIGEARVEIASIASASHDPSTVMPAPVPPRRSREIAAWTLAGVAITAAIAGFVRPWSTPPGAARAGPVVQLPFVPSGTVPLTEVAETTISPDGRTLLFRARSTDGRRQLWVRRLDALDAEPLPDTVDAGEPFWSPDSRSVAFGAQGKIKRIDLGAARAQVLADAARSNNGAWSPSGVIVFSPDYTSPLMQVPADGGATAPATTLDLKKGEVNHRYPVFLPDGRHFLYGAFRSSGPTVKVGSLDSTDNRELLPGASLAVYAPPGWLLYRRNGVIVAHAFNADRLELSGEPAPIAAPARNAEAEPSERLSVSTNGTLVVQVRSAPGYELGWFDRSGRQRSFPSPPLTEVADSDVPRISPDGRRVVIQRRGTQTHNWDLWLGDLARGTYDRLTTQPTVEQMPLWSVDGRRVYFATQPNPVDGGIYSVPVAGGREELVVKASAVAVAESPDGKWLIYQQRGERTRLDLWVVPLTGTDRTPRAIVNSEFNDYQAHLSTDGHWLAYVSDSTGSNEVYVRRFSDGAVSDATRVSTEGGVQPLWSRDGRELFFVNASRGYLDAQMMTVPATSNGGSLDFGAAVPLFKMSMLPVGFITRDYDVAPDGRFLIGTAKVNPQASTSTILLNWAAGLAK